MTRGNAISASCGSHLNIDIAPKHLEGRLDLIEPGIVIEAEKPINGFAIPIQPPCQTRLS